VFHQVEAVRLLGKRSKKYKLSYFCKYPDSGIEYEINAGSNVPVMGGMPTT
jgi:hypothetical protein